MERKQALGIIETRGLTPLVTAVDAALKAANVALESRRLVGGGLVNATVTGDVGAVKAAMEAAGAQVAAMGAAGRTWVIPRPATDVWAMLARDGVKTAPPLPVVRTAAAPPAVRPEPEVPAVRAEAALPAVKTPPPRKPRKNGGKK